MFAKDASKQFKTRALIILIISFITMYCSGMFGTDIINVIQNPIMEKLGISATQSVLGWTVGGSSGICGRQASYQIVPIWLVQLPPFRSEMPFASAYLLSFLARQTMDA